MVSAYSELKKANPKFPILIRECQGVEAKLIARYGAPGRGAGAWCFCGSSAALTACLARNNKAGQHVQHGIVRLGSALTSFARRPALRCRLWQGAGCEHREPGQGGHQQGAGAASAEGGEHAQASRVAARCQHAVPGSAHLSVQVFMRLTIEVGLEVQNALSLPKRSRSVGRGLLTVLWWHAVQVDRE